MAKVKALKLTWKKDDGSHEETDDLTLWANEHPLNITISGAIAGEYGILWMWGMKFYIGDSRKEIKNFFKNDDECQRLLVKQLALLGLDKYYEV